MPRRQRFKPSRKPKPSPERVEEPTIGSASAPARDEEYLDDSRPGPRDEVHPDDVEIEEHTG
jgi:hypothetical protein